MYSTQYFIDFNCSLVHLPSQSGLSRLVEPPPLSCHQGPQSRHLPTTPHGPRPKSRLLQALAARNSALSATGSPGLQKPTSCCRQGVRLPFSSSGRPETRPPAGPGRRPSFPTFPRPVPGQHWPGHPPGRRGRPPASRDPRRPPRSPPTPAASAHPGSRTSCGVSASPTAAHPGRDSLASERARSAKGPGEVAGGRGRGRAHSTASASTTRLGG